MIFIISNVKIQKMIRISPFDVAVFGLFGF